MTGTEAVFNANICMSPVSPSVDCRCSLLCAITQVNVLLNAYKERGNWVRLRDGIRYWRYAIFLASLLSRSSASFITSQKVLHLNDNVSRYTGKN